MSAADQVDGPAAGAPALTAAAILERGTAPPQPLYVAEWGGTVYVREMTGAERDAFELSCSAGGKPSLANLRARLAVRTLCDAEGKRLFRDDQADELGRQSGRALDKIADFAAELNAINQADVQVLAGN